MSLLPSSSQLRFAMAYILITAVVLFFLNIYTSTTLRNMIFSAQRQTMEDRTQLMTTALLQLDELTSTKVEAAINALEDLSTTRTVVTDASGMAVYDSLVAGNAEGKLLLFPEIVTALSGKDVFYSSYADGAIESRAAVPLVKNGQMLGTVYLMLYDIDQGALIDALQTNVLRLSVALAVGMILFSMLFSTAFSRRMRRILHSVRMMRDGDYSHKLTLRGHDELDQLGREFNDLAERLEASEQRRRQFVSDASHELKTPLASIKLLSDSILQNDMDLATQREFISDIGREADRLGRLSQKLLTLTKLDSAVLEEREILDAAATVQKVTRMLQPLATLRKIRLGCTLSDGCTVMTVEDDLYQIVFNLAENAIKYNREGGWVKVSLSRKEEEVVLCVADNGVGIPEESMAHIFERFYRVDKSHSKASGGTGLGLSIVKHAVQYHHGSIELQSAPGKGTTVRVFFPEARE